MNQAFVSPAVVFDGSDKPNQSIQIDQIQDRRIYRLPQRDLSSASKHGWAAVVCGLFGMMLGLWWMATTTGPELWNNAPDWGMVALGSIGLIAIVPAIGIAYCGVAILRNKTYCTIELDQDGLVSRDRIGIFSWSRNQHAATITRLRIAKDSRVGPRKLLTDSGLTLTNWLRNWRYSLVAETSDGREYLVAVGYGRELLLKLAQDLVPRLNLQSTRVDPKIKSPSTGLPGRERIGAIELVDTQRLPKSKAIDPAVPKPATSDATIERRDDGITVRVPPIGFKGNWLYVSFCVVWNGFVLLAVYIFADSNLWNALCVVLHALAGIGITLGTIHLSLGKTVLSTAGDQLLIESGSPIRSKEYRWSRDRIHEIKVDKANIDAETRLMDLQIFSVGEPKFNCLWQRPTEELEWIASELRHSLRIHPGSSASFAKSDADGRPMPLTTSHLSVQYTGDVSGVDSIAINVPQRGIRRYLSGMLAGIVCLLASTAFFVFALVAGTDEPFFGEFLFGWALILSLLGAAFLFHFLAEAKANFWIHADHRQLQIRQGGMLKTNRYIFDRQDLESLQISQSTTKGSKGYQSEIIVCPGDPDSVTLMRGFDHDDLVFVADSINRTMNLE